MVVELDEIGLSGERTVLVGVSTLIDLSCCLIGIVIDIRLLLRWGVLSSRGLYICSTDAD